MAPPDIRPFPNVGAEIFDCDLSRLTVGDGDQLEAAFAAFGLLVFRNQIVSADDLERFAERWGKTTLDISASVGDHPGVWFGGDSYSPVPELGMMVHVPGGVDVMPDDLAFASLTDAFETLAGPTARALEGLTGIHRSPTGDEVSHPLVIRHPVSGKSSIYTNPMSAIGVDGLEEQAALQLLNELFDHCQSEEFVTKVDWQPGTVMLWDNRALWQFDHGGVLRGEAQRVRIAGTKLTPAVRPDKSDPSLVQRAGATLAGGIITAAMSGIAEVLEPERLRQDIEIVSEAPDREPIDDGLDFGGLPPLD